MIFSNKPLFKTSTEDTSFDVEVLKPSMPRAPKFKKKPINGSARAGIDYDVYSSKKELSHRSSK
jgi:hypothetical protein